MKDAPEKSALNGSADRLAAAFRDVVQDAVSPLGERISELEAKIESRFDGVDKELAEVRGELTYARSANQLTR